MNNVIEIENLAFGGYGIGRLDGMKVFVPYTIPGEKVRLHTVDPRKRYAWGKLKEVVVSSPQRQSPPCPYFGRCGGCQWQHITDPVQVFWKDRIFRDVLLRIGAVPAHKIKPLMPSRSTYRYRDRVTLKIRKGIMGFLSERSHTLVKIDHCLITFHQINEALARFQGRLSFLPPCELEIVGSPFEEGVMIWARFENKLLPKEKEELKGIFRESGFVKYLGISSIKEQLEIFLIDGHPDIPGLSFKLDPFCSSTNRILELVFSPGVFIQINWEQNMELIHQVLGAINQLGKSLQILELYAGAGNFTVPIADAGHTVVTVEKSDRAVSNARFNLSRNHINGVVIRRQNTEKALLEMVAQGQKFDILVADPPRTGLKKEIPIIAKLKIPYLFYISCDPATLSRDLKVLREAGYETEYVQALDFFPQTYHIESVSFLRLC